LGQFDQNLALSRAKTENRRFRARATRSTLTVARKGKFATIRHAGGGLGLSDDRLLKGASVEVPMFEAPPHGSGAADDQLVLQRLSARAK